MPTFRNPFEIKGYKAQSPRTVRFRATMFFRKLVEVRGVEPLSGKCSTQATTCVFLRLISPFHPPKDRLAKGPASLSRPRANASRDPAFRFDSVPEERYLGTEFGRTVRRPLRKNNLPQLWFAGFFYEANQHPRHAPWALPNPSKTNTPP